MYSQLPRPAIFAHRGSSAYAPENTLAAFELAIAQGADAIELDAKLCADGQHVVIIHDRTVDRTTNGSGNVQALSLQAIKELDAGSWFNTAFGDQRIPTLADVFDTVGGRIFINVELTNYASPNDELPNRVVELIIQYGLEKQVLLSSFNPRALRRVHQLMPNLPLALLALPGFAGSWARSWIGRWIVPYQALHPERGDTSANLVEKQQANKQRVHVWTVNNPDDMQLLFQWQVDGIFTDDVLLARQIRNQVTI